MQIRLLPLCHDNSYSEEDLFPFAKREDGTYDFNKYDEEYFNNVEVSLEKAYEYGITVCLHLLWVNYIPNTWASSKKTSLPYDSMEPLYTYIINSYKKYEPIYAASSDIRFECQKVINYCLKVMKIVKLNDPEGLCTLHLAPNEDPPQVILSSPYYDFYTF